MTHTRQILFLRQQLELNDNKKLSDSPPNELRLQQLWFEHQLPRHLTTLGGQRIEVLHCGFWNHGPGPDFLNASILITEQNRILNGHVEIHTYAADWQRHGHHQDAAYANTILHVALHGTEPALHRDVGSLPSVELHPQLDEETLALLGEPGPVAVRPLPRARVDQQPHKFKTLTNEQLRETLHRAGLLRLYRKARALALQRRRDGERQTLWEALAVALGYAENKIPFRLLARAIAHKHAELRDQVLRDALLFGASGFLPREQIHTLPPENRTYITRLWHAWWSHPLSSEQGRALDTTAWKLAPVRPANHPHRRIGALSALAPLITQILTALQRADHENAAQILRSASHPYFDTHYHLTSPARENMPALLGETRSVQILWNVLLPWTLSTETLADSAKFVDLPAEPHNVRMRTALQSLFASGRAPFRLDGLARQGLMTILDDLC